MQFTIRYLRAITPASVIIATLSAIPSHAQTVLLTNLNSSSVGRATSLNAPSGGQFGPQDTPYNSKASGFLMPTNASYVLGSVNLDLQFFDLASSPMVEIYADNGLNNPGNLLITLTDPMITLNSDVFSFTPTSTFTLAAGTEYWIVVSNQASSQDSFFWLSSEPDMPTGIAASTGYRLENGVIPPHNPSNVFNKFSVVGSAAVPEASTIVTFGFLLALGAGGAVITVRKKKAAA